MRVVLDASAFDVIDGPQGARLRQLLRDMATRGHSCWCSAVTLAEVCRGTARTRRVEVALARDRGGARIRVQPTDELVAKLVGSILHTAGRASDALADAHVVAIAAADDLALVVTDDPTDILGLATAIPATRVVVRSPLQ